MRYDIFIDESGTLADPADRFVVVAAVASKNASSLVKLIPKARKRLPPKRKLKRERLISEFKFRSVGDKTKGRILKEISKADLALFVAVIDKERRSVSDNPKNYAILVWTVLGQCVKNLEIGSVVIDRHFNQNGKQKQFNEEIYSLAKRTLTIIHADSLVDSRVDLADFVAGAILRAVRNKDSRFKEIIRAKIAFEKLYSWRKISKACGPRPR